MNDNLLASNQPDSKKYKLILKKHLVLKQNSPATDASNLVQLFENTDKLPNETEFEWIYKPDTSKLMISSGKVKVTFPDNSTSEIQVNFEIVPDNNSKNSEIDIKKDEQVKTAGLNFSFINSSKNLEDLSGNIVEAINLFKHGYYRQMSNTLRQGLEIIVDKLLILNEIPFSEKWNSMNLSYQLSYIAYIRLLPKRIIDLAFSIKNYGNLGSHHYKSLNFTKTSALNDLSQYHDLLVYLVNVYENKDLNYADVQITSERYQKPKWYKRPEVDVKKLPSFDQYLINRKNQETDSEFTEKTTHFVWNKIIIICLIIINLIIGGVIAYKVSHNKSQSNSAKTSQVKIPIKQQASSLDEKEIVSLSILYAKNNLGKYWQDAYNTLSKNNFKLSRFKHYIFGEADVTVSGNNYIYVLSQNIGFASQQTKKGMKVTFFDLGQKNPVDHPKQIYTCQMLKTIKDKNLYTKYKDLINMIQFDDNHS